MWDVRFGMGHRVRSQRSDVRSQTTEDRRQKRAELVEEWSMMSDWGFWIADSKNSKLEVIHMLSSVLCRLYPRRP